METVLAPSQWPNKAHGCTGERAEVGGSKAKVSASAPGCPQRQGWAASSEGARARSRGCRQTIVKSPEIKCPRRTGVGDDVKVNPLGWSRSHESLVDLRSGRGRKVVRILGEGATCATER